jgi:peptide/nickel transport system substrate-binding protein
MLKVKVAAGELPPVEERLPEEPLVMKPKEIGQYGGTGRFVAMEIGECNGVTFANFEPMLRPTRDFKEIRANIVKKWSLSKDNKTLTLYLRKGIKWSDGVPFTANDIMFWYEDMTLNDELTPVKPKIWSPGGKLMSVEKVDDYTVRLHFAVPYPPSVGLLTAHVQSIQNGLYAPKHYLKEFHIKYNPKANELAKEEGHDYWYQLFWDHADVWAGRRDVNLPVLSPWILKKRTVDRKIFERNPYYFKVDNDGNQLPYLDKVTTSIVASEETLKLKMLSGEVDFEGYKLGPHDLPLLMENREKGDYHILLWPTGQMADPGLAFNWNHKDPVLRKIFRGVRFRRAMSLAINRDEINQVAYLGLAEPRALEVFPYWSFYDEKRAKAYTDHNPEKANRLLDEMGLKWDANHEYRLRPDGKTLSLKLEGIPLVEGRPFTVIGELIKDYWKDVGIKLSVKTIERSLFEQRLNAGEHDIGIWAAGGGYGLESVVQAWPEHFVFDHWSLGIAPEWNRWNKSGGKLGEEPPEDVKDYLKLWDEVMEMRVGTQEYLDTMKKAFDYWSEQVFVVSLVGLTKNPILVKNNLYNIPEEVVFQWAGLFSKVTDPETWFFKK